MPDDQQFQAMIQNGTDRAKAAIHDTAADLEELSRSISIAHMARGTHHLQQGMSDAAIADFNQAIQVDPRNAEAYYHRSLAHGRQGDSDHALADLRTAIRLDPDAADTEAHPTHLEAGYKVIARFEGPARDRLLATYPLTPEGRREATRYADQLGRDPVARSHLDGRYQVDYDVFDSVVLEFRSLTRELHRAPALDEHGHRIDE